MLCSVDDKTLHFKHKSVFAKPYLNNFFWMAVSYNKLFKEKIMLCNIIQLEEDRILLKNMLNVSWSIHINFVSFSCIKTRVGWSNFSFVDIFKKQWKNRWLCMHEFDKRSTVLFVLTKGKYFNSAKIIFIALRSGDWTKILSLLNTLGK